MGLMDFLKPADINAGVEAVSYTHLDVYKRQSPLRPNRKSRLHRQLQLQNPQWRIRR